MQNSHCHKNFDSVNQPLQWQLNNWVYNKSPVFHEVSANGVE